MNRWQRIWLYLVIAFSGLHIVRDIFQDLGIENFLSTTLASPGPPKVNYMVYWTVFNTYAIAFAEIVLAIICLKRNTFGRLGIATMIIAAGMFLLWLYYFFVL